jgi:hypothetical protein
MKDFVLAVLLAWIFIWVAGTVRTMTPLSPVDCQPPVTIRNQGMCPTPTPKEKP